MSPFRRALVFSGFHLTARAKVRPGNPVVNRRETMYRVSDAVRSTHGQDGAVILDIRQGQLYNLNLVGSRILELLKSGLIGSAIVTQVSQEFDVSESVAEHDFREFIDALKKHQLVCDLAPDVSRLNQEDGLGS